MEDSEYEDMISAMVEIGRELSREDVLDCFCNRALRLFISDQAKSPSPSPSKMFARLQETVDGRAEIHELERGMDKQHFVELVTGGYFMPSGIDAKTKFPIFWLRTGLIDRDSWSYEYGSPRGKAFIRAKLFFFEAAAAQAMTKSDTDDGCRLALYFDESERRYLDFNLRLISEFLRLLDNVIIVNGGKRLVISGASKFFSVVFNAATKVAPRLATDTGLDIIQHEDVEGLVENASDIPEFWFGDGEGKPYLPSDRRNIWAYERCLSEENRITPRGIYNPEPWPYEECSYDGIVTPARRRSRQLEAIEEDEEEEDW